MEINEACEVLSDPEKRARYDQLGSECSRWQQAGRRLGDSDWKQCTSGAPGEGGQRVHVRYSTPEDSEVLSGAGCPFSVFCSQI